MNSLLRSPRRNLIFGGFYMLVVIACATLAYIAAGWTPGDALYMVVLTVYTVGYDEVRSVDTPLLRGITIATIVFGCTGMIFLTGALIQLFTLNELQQFFGQKRMQTQIDRLRDHVIVCGFGRIGQMLARELHAGRAPFMVLERTEARFNEARALGYICLLGDATDEAALAHAGVARARTLATVLPDDAANVFITLSARSLNAGLQIIARGEAPSTERKLLQAGASRVVLPTHIGAERIAEMILYPQTAHLRRGTDRLVFEAELRALGLDLEVAAAAAGSEAVGRSIAAVEQAAGGAFFVVAITRRGADRIVRPDGATLIEAGDGVELVGRDGLAGALGAWFEARTN